MQFAEDEVEFLFRPSGQSIDAQPTIRPPGEAGRKMFPSRLGPAAPHPRRGTEELKVLVRGQQPEQPAILGYVTDPAATCDPPGRGSDQAGADLKQGRFPAPVGPDHGCDLSGAQGEVQTAEHPLAPVALTDLVQAEQEGPGREVVAEPPPGSGAAIAACRAPTTARA
jgi:hypothetical protein